MQRAISLRCKILHQYCHQSLQIQWWWLGKMRPVVKTWRFESNLICSKSAFVLWSTRELEQSSNSNFHISTAWSDYKSVRSLPSNRRNTLKLNVLYIKMWPKKLGSKLTEKWRKRQYLDDQVDLRKVLGYSLGGRVVVVLILAPGVVVAPRPPPFKYKAGKIFKFCIIF